MKYKLIIKTKAELDILKLFNWYENKKIGLGSEFLEEIEKKLNLITKDPLHYQIRY